MFRLVKKTKFHLSFMQPRRTGSQTGMNRWVSGWYSTSTPPSISGTMATCRIKLWRDLQDRSWKVKTQMSWSIMLFNFLTSNLGSPTKKGTVVPLILIIKIETYIFIYTFHIYSYIYLREKNLFLNLHIWILPHMFRFVTKNSHFKHHSCNHGTQRARQDESNKNQDGCKHIFSFIFFTYIFFYIFNEKKNAFFNLFKF